jgi:hypothetical protein
MKSWKAGQDGRVGQKTEDGRQETGDRREKREDGRQNIEDRMRFGDEFPACRDMRFACASTLTLILITSYFVSCVLYIIQSWVSSEF